jgi:hypothetical protein
MVHVTYEIVEHNGGWAYKVADVFSETFATRELARHAAEDAAARHEQAGTDEDIQYPDEDGDWRTEHASGDERPDTDVAG